MCQVDPQSDTELVLGFGKGDVIYYEAEKPKMTNFIMGGVTQATKKSLYSQKDSKKHEGSIILVMYCQKILAWSTNSRILARYYPKGLKDKAYNNIC